MCDTLLPTQKQTAEENSVCIVVWVSLGCGALLVLDGVSIIYSDKDIVLWRSQSEGRLGGRGGDCLSAWLDLRW